MRSRVRQFLRAGRQPTDADHNIAARNLEPNLLDLFLRQHPRDIVHSAATARWLLDRGHDEPDLVAAALLHDIGKGEQRRIDRVAYVAAGWLRLIGALASDRSRLALRRAVARSQAHALAGAQLLAQAGAAAAVVDLTLRHHSPPGGDPVLALLQQADAAN